MNTSYTGISGNSIIYSVYAGGGISLNIYYLTNGTLYFLTRYTNSDTTFTTTQTFNDSQWHHISVTIDVPNLERKIYIDNSLVSTQALSSNAYGGSGTTGVALGTNGNFNTQYYKGDLDQVRIFNKAISSAEVSKLYGNGAGEIACAYTSTTDNVAYPIANTAYYKLDNNSKDSARSTGKFNEGAIFNGSSSKITSMPPITANSSYTISLWFKTSSSARQSIIASNSSSHSIALNINNGQLAIHETSVGDSDTFTGTWNDGNWHHLVMVNKSAIWVDGVSRGTTTQDLFENEKLEFGYWEHSGPIYYFNGSLDQVRIYNTALDSTDISNLYAETVSDTSTLSFPSGKTAIATYQLDGNSTDLSGNYNGTDTDVAYAYDGTETNIEYRFGRFGQAAVFNGTSSKINTGIASISAPFAVSMWINENVLASGMFFGNWNSTAADMYFQTTSDGRLRISIDGYSQEYFGTAGDVQIS
jgi:hypothetical protein